MPSIEVSRYKRIERLDGEALAARRAASDHEMDVQSAWQAAVAAHGIAAADAGRHGTGEAYKARERDAAAVLADTKAALDEARAETAKWNALLSGRRQLKESAEKYLKEISALPRPIVIPNRNGSGIPNVTVGLG